MSDGGGPIRLADVGAAGAVAPTEDAFVAVQARGSRARQASGAGCALADASPRQVRRVRPLHSAPSIDRATAY